MSALTVGEELTIQCAAETAARVATALEAAPSSLRLDLSTVQELDTAGLQVLLWAAREATAAGIALELDGSPAVREVLDFTGLADTLPCSGEEATR